MDCAASLWARATNLFGLFLRSSWSKLKSIFQHEFGSLRHCFRRYRLELAYDQSFRSTNDLLDWLDRMLHYFAGYWTSRNRAQLERLGFLGYRSVTARLYFHVSLSSESRRCADIHPDTIRQSVL